MPRVLFVVTEESYFVTHRLGLARAASRAGFQVAIATRLDRGTLLGAAAGMEIFGLSWKRRKGGLLPELRTLVELCRVCRRWGPDLVFCVALKPAVVAGIVCRLLGVRRQVIAIAGLGQSFSDTRLFWRLIRTGVTAILAWLTRPATVRVITQNEADEAFVRGTLGVPASRILCQPGVGVDLHSFTAHPPPDGVPVFTYAGRFLRSKGVLDFLVVARELRAAGIPMQCQVVGEPDQGSRDSLAAADIEEFVSDGSVRWIHRTDRMPEVLAGSHVIVLPTKYGEGVPKILLEAAASGRAVIASDTPGCRAVVIDGQSGLLVQPGDRVALRESMVTLASDPALARSMGEAGRARAEREFAESGVAAGVLALLDDLMRAV